jgi:hypothetical protein
MRKYIFLSLKIFGALFALLVLAFIFLPSYCSDTAGAKIAEASMWSRTGINKLVEHCEAGTLVAGMSHEALGLDETAKPGQYIQKMVVVVDSPQRARVITTLDDITNDLSVIWSSVAVPAGAVIETEFQCDDKKWTYGAGKGTTVPVRYLPSSLRPRTDST